VDFFAKHQCCDVSLVLFGIRSYELVSPRCDVSDPEALLSWLDPTPEFPLQEIKIIAPKNNAIILFIFCQFNDMTYWIKVIIPDWLSLDPTRILPAGIIR
jgi:hypothetical protein